MIRPWKEPTGTTLYEAAPFEDWPMDEDTSFKSSRMDAYLALTNMLGGSPLTIPEIYSEHTRKLGLSYADTTDIVRGAVRFGYLRKAKQEVY